MNDEQSQTTGFSGFQIDELMEVDERALTTLVDQGVHIEGKITLKGGRHILISGRVTGSIESDGVVVVNGGAEVVGSIRAKSVQVAGTVRRGADGGELDVQDTLVLGKGAKVQCDAKYGDLKAEHGVQIAGNIRPRNMDAEDMGERTSDSSSSVIDMASRHSPAPVAAAGF